MIEKKYKVLLSREVLNTLPGGSGVIEIDVMEATLLVHGEVRNIAAPFDGKPDGFRFPGKWQIVKMEEEIQEEKVAREDDPPVEDFVRYKDEEIATIFGCPAPAGRYVIRSDQEFDKLDDRRVWDRDERKWIAQGSGVTGWMQRFANECKTREVVMPDRIARTEKSQPRPACFGLHSERAVACVGLCLNAKECLATKVKA